MPQLRVDGRHEAKCGVDDQDEQVYRCLQVAVQAQWNSATRDGNVPQVLDHVLRDAQGIGANQTGLAQVKQLSYPRASLEYVHEVMSTPKYADALNPPPGTYYCGNAAWTRDRR